MVQYLYRPKYSFCIWKMRSLLKIHFLSSAYVSNTCFKDQNTNIRIYNSTTTFIWALSIYILMIISRWCLYNKHDCCKSTIQVFSYCAEYTFVLKDQNTIFSIEQNLLYRKADIVVQSYCRRTMHETAMCETVICEQSLRFSTVCDNAWNYYVWTTEDCHVWTTRETIVCGQYQYHNWYSRMWTMPKTVACVHLRFSSVNNAQECCVWTTVEIDSLCVYCSSQQPGNSTLYSASIYSIREITCINWHEYI